MSSRKISSLKDNIITRALLEDKLQLFTLRIGLAIGAFIATTFDSISTYIGLYYSNGILYEGNPALAGMIAAKGLFVGIILGWAKNILLILLVGYSRLTNQLAIFCFVMMIGASSYGFIGNAYLIITTL